MSPDHVNVGINQLINLGSYSFRRRLMVICSASWYVRAGFLWNISGALIVLPSVFFISVVWCEKKSCFCKTQIFLDSRHPLFPSTSAEIIFAIHRADRNHIWFPILFILSVIAACNQPNFHFFQFYSQKKKKSPWRRKRKETAARS